VDQVRPAQPRVDVLFEPTPPAVVDAMLELAKVGPDDLLIDLGSGDGRIPIAAARTYGARALGVDVDPRRVRQARENAKRRGAAGEVCFVEGDLLKSNIGEATVVAIFLSPEINLKLRPQLLELPAGTRIVSHEHDMGRWEPDRMRLYPAGRGVRGDRRLFLWVVPAKVNGALRLSVDGRALDVTIRQRYQRLHGTVFVDGKPRPIRNGRLDGTRVNLHVPIGSGLRHLRGEVTPAGVIQGEGWKAERRG
jgi:SAM-dependent methyltransferase